MRMHSLTQDSRVDLCGGFGTRVRANIESSPWPNWGTRNTNSRFSDSQQGILQFRGEPQAIAKISLEQNMRCVGRVRIRVAQPVAQKSDQAGGFALACEVYTSGKQRKLHNIRS